MNSGYVTVNGVNSNTYFYHYQEIHYRYLQSVFATYLHQIIICYNLNKSAKTDIPGFTLFIVLLIHFRTLQVCRYFFCVSFFFMSRISSAISTSDFSSGGSTIFRMIANSAAGTIPEPPKISVIACGICARTAEFAPSP